MIRLSKISEIQFGLYSKKSEKGNVKYLTTGHFDEFLNLSLFTKDSYIELEEKNKRFLLQPNDVILTGKGQRIFAWAYNEAFGDIVPSSLFYIIKTKANEVNGYYLASVLNSARKQYELTLLGSGSSVLSINKKDLLDLEIPLPSLKEQNRIAKVLKVMENEVSLTSELLNKKRALKKGVLNELITNKTKL